MQHFTSNRENWDICPSLKSVYLCFGALNRKRIANRVNICPCSLRIHSLFNFPLFQKVLICIPKLTRGSHGCCALNTQCLCSPSENKLFCLFEHFLPVVELAVGSQQTNTSPQTIVVDDVQSTTGRQMGRLGKKPPAELGNHSLRDGPAQRSRFWPGGNGS